MAWATDADLLAWYPALSTADPILRADALDSSKQFMSITTWGVKLRIGHIHLTAHLLLSQAESAAGGGGGSGGGGSGGGGPVSSMSMGPVSISYEVSSDASDSWFGSTSAGRAYLEMRKSLGSMAFSMSRCL